MPVIILTYVYTLCLPLSVLLLYHVSAAVEPLARVSYGLAVLLVLKLFFSLLCQFQLCFPVPSGSLFITMILENLVSSFTLQC